MREIRRERKAEELTTNLTNLTNATTNPTPVHVIPDAAARRRRSGIYSAPAVK